MSEFYLLYGEKVLPVSEEVWRQRRIVENSPLNWVVNATALPNDVTVSTVFWGKSPTMFETVVFYGKGDRGRFLDSYATYQEAKEGHARWVENFSND